ncbi:MAG: IS630 family transposase [Actinomycetota bacterium]|nr:IS630 family transposase [Actinomycetota bacterium]
MERLVRRPKSAQAMALRARIVLACAEGATNQAVAAELGVSPSTVTKWRNRFVDRRLQGLIDEYRSGAPRTVTDDKVEAVIVKTLEERPANATHWSTRSMAKATGMSQTSISQIWRAFNLQPHRSESFKLSTDPLFVDKVKDIVALYLDPPERAAVICVDEKSQIQALNRYQPILPMMPATPERRSHDYVRHGTTSLFAALDMTTGKVIGSLHHRHRAVEFKKFLQLIDTEVPGDLEVHLVLDNYATHKTPDIQRWLLRHPRFELHFTPTSGSWLNMVERWFAELTTKRIKRGSHISVRALEKDIREWIATWNSDPHPYLWHKTADQILESLARYCERISNSAH